MARVTVVATAEGAVGVARVLAGALLVGVMGGVAAGAGAVVFWSLPTCTWTRRIRETPEPTRTWL